MATGHTERHRHGACATQFLFLFFIIPYWTHFGNYAQAKRSSLFDKKEVRSQNRELQFTKSKFYTVVMQTRGQFAVLRRQAQDGWQCQTSKLSRSSAKPNFKFAVSCRAAARNAAHTLGAASELPEVRPRGPNFKRRGVASTRAIPGLAPPGARLWACQAHKGNCPKFAAKAANFTRPNTSAPYSV